MSTIPIVDHSVRDSWVESIHDLQDHICTQLELADGKERFAEDSWTRPEGGSGKTRVIAKGNVFEKGGVNTSVVYGNVTEPMRRQLNIKGEQWFACGISIVIHPFNPFVPTIHCNYRMFELYDADGILLDRWFGGGSDLTPYYLFEEDAKHFHQVHKDTCDAFDTGFYPRFKKECDNYFVNWHRNEERRGIGGIFYDYQRGTEQLKNDDASVQNTTSAQHSGTPLAESGKGMSVDQWMKFGRACGETFLHGYLPIVEKRKNTGFTADQKKCQEIRRGRYVEFNLVHDRGTLFGLRTNGRIESILMSLPPTVQFEYNYHPMPGTPEDKLVQVCLNPRDWI
jgi:coproporphyrinogen III oxidase